MTEVNFTLPDNLAHEAEVNGLLTAQALESLLRAELLRRLQSKLMFNGDQANHDQAALEAGEQPEAAPVHEESAPAESALAQQLSGPPPRPATEPWEVEYDIVIKMPPKSYRPVKIHVTHLGRAKPRFVNDSGLDEE